jgi:hypothetical protein
MPTLVFEQKPGSFGHDQIMLYEEHYLRRGQPVRYVPIKHLRQKRADALPKADEVVAGSIDFVHAALQSLSLPVPPIVYYPEALQPWLHRRIWMTTLGEAVARLGTVDEPVFVKPAERLKAFTGNVFHEAPTLASVPYPKKGRVWCSLPVAWHAEWRTYVVDGKIKAISHYAGDDLIQPDRAEIEKAVAALLASGWPSRNFCCDFGLLSTGETACVEYGDGYSMGAYDVAREDYYAMIFNWWREQIARSN